MTFAFLVLLTVFAEAKWFIIQHGVYKELDTITVVKINKCLTDGHGSTMFKLIDTKVNYVTYSDNECKTEDETKEDIKGIITEDIQPWLDKSAYYYEIYMDECKSELTGYLIIPKDGCVRDVSSEYETAGKLLYLYAEYDSKKIKLWEIAQEGYNTCPENIKDLQNAKKYEYNIGECFRVTDSTNYNKIQVNLTDGVEPLALLVVFIVLTVMF